MAIGNRSTDLTAADPDGIVTDILNEIGYSLDSVERVSSSGQFAATGTKIVNGKPLRSAAMGRTQVLAAHELVKVVTRA